jgi:hypothetical protein
VHFNACADALHASKQSAFLVPATQATSSGNFFACLPTSGALKSASQPVSLPIKSRRRLAVAALLLCCGLSALLLGGCADVQYVDTIHRPEAPYDTYYGPYYYPYYPWYAYYGGAYYYGNVSR